MLLLLSVATAYFGKKCSTMMILFKSILLTMFLGPGHEEFTINEVLVVV